MARPEKNTVTYFPLDCEDGKKMYYIEETYGNDGYATFIKLLRELARSEYHYLDLSKSTTLMFLSSKCKVTKEILLAIVKDLVELEKFDRQLWEEQKVIWCQDFIDSIQDAYLKRKNKCMTKEGLLQLLISLGVRKHKKNDVFIPENTQIREEEIITEESREEKTKIPYGKIVSIFNSVCVDLPKVEKITEVRKKAIANRIKENSYEVLGEVFQKVAESDFLSGRKSDWKASFDWIMNPVNFVKILENNYKNNGNGGNSKSNAEIFTAAINSDAARDFKY